MFFSSLVSFVKFNHSINTTKQIWIWIWIWIAKYRRKKRRSRRCRILNALVFYCSLLDDGRRINKSNAKKNKSTQLICERNRWRKWKLTRTRIFRAIFKRVRSAWTGWTYFKMYKFSLTLSLLCVWKLLRLGFSVDFFLYFRCRVCSK